jgi:hypothetical protein
MILLRKLLNGRNSENRILAIHGMSTLLTNCVPKDEDQDNIVASLRPAFGYSLDVREHLFKNVSLLLHKIKKQRLSEKVKCTYYILISP